MHFVNEVSVVFSNTEGTKKTQAKTKDIRIQSLALLAHLLGR